MAVNAQELRIGSIVYAGTDENDKPMMCEVGAIDKSYISWEGNKTNLEYVNGVPLTTELLEKCGFRNREEIGHNIKLFEIKILNIVPDQTEEGYFGARILFGMSGPFTIAKHIRFLHEVQNIYYSLTGTELTIQLI